MRSLSFPSMTNWITAESAVGGSQRDNVRGRTVAGVSVIMLGACLLAVAGATMALTDGVVVPLLALTVTLAGAVTSIALQRRRNVDAATSVQFFTLLCVGAVFALANPGIVDFGLAIALMAPVHASLLARPRQKILAWVLALAVVALASVASFAWISSFPQSAYSPVLGVGGFAMAALVVSYAAHRVNAAFEVYEKSSINAFRHLVEHVRDAVLRFGSNGEVEFVSQSSTKLLGCERYVLSAEGIVERLHPLDRPTYMKALDEANVRGFAQTVEVRLRRDDPSGMSEFIWVEVSFSPVVNEHQHEARYEVVALLRDISQRKAIEAEMQDARRSAEEISEAKSHFLATVGHELRTPLNAIVGFSEMMSTGIAGELSDGNREYADIIHQSGKHLLDIVNTLLDMSKIEAGKFELQTDSVSPEKLIDESLRIVDSLARSRNVTFKTETGPGLPHIICDERACRQIFINLLSNAVKFSHEGGEVTIRLRRQGQHVSFAVVDHGIGMPKDVVNRLGEAFFQAQGGLSRHYEGTGLGLSIVKGLVELHEGTLHAQSSEGEGTTMYVLLPINGPATKSVHSAVVTSLPRDSSLKPVPTWQDPRSIAL